MSPFIKYVIITPVRDEEKYVEKTIESVISQTILPTEWIIVNDGSCDRTGIIIDRYSEKNEWIKTIHRSNRGFRKSGGGVIEAFYGAYFKLATTDWNFLVKLDGDLSFDSTYFEKCFQKFAANPMLGLGSGLVYKITENGTEIDSVGDPPFHVRGASKIYRRACWDQISPLVRSPGWDTIDEVKANMNGWETRTFQDLKIIQHKPTGGADGNWKNWFKNGRANYITGYHPIFMLAKCVKRIFQRPFFLSSISLFLGYCSGYMTSSTQINDKKAITYLRKQQLNRLLLKSSIYK